MKWLERKKKKKRGQGKKKRQFSPQLAIWKAAEKAADPKRKRRKRPNS